MSSRKKNSVLIVDDERSSISALRNILNIEYTIYASSNGQDAIETAEEFLPDIILLDVMMPDMDGYDVITVLKKSDNTRDIPVIIITGLGNTDDEEKGLALGAADYITKPFHPAIVKLRVQNHIRLVERLRQQALMVKVSQNFLTGAYAVPLYSDTLRMVGEFMNIAAVLLYRFDEQNNTLFCQNEWINSKLKIETRIGDRVEIDEQLISAIKIMHNTLAAQPSDSSGNKNNLYFHSNDPLLKDILKSRGSHLENFITTPIYTKGRLSAVLIFLKDDSEWVWTENESDIAILVNSIFSGVFERDAMESQYSIVENSPNIVMSVSSDTGIQYINPAALELTGYSKSELMEKGLSAIFEANTLAEIREKHIPSSASGEAVLFEAEIRRKNGEKRILMISINPAEKNNFIIITRDLTEIRELENGLILSKEHAEYLSRAKSEFLSRMSHEMRTPMNAIMGLLQIAEIQGIPDSMKDFCNKIKTASYALLHLIDDVLDFSDMEYDVFKLSESVFDFNIMIRDILLAADDKASKKRQLINCSIDPQIPISLIGDEKRLKQVTLNLLGNAVKFSPEDGEINFNAYLQPAEDSKTDSDNETIIIKFEVTDNGVGISKEQQSRLFSVFEQGDGSISREHSGIGIGLALSKRIIEMLGGTIWVESELGKGAKFYFTCKLKKKK